MCSYVFVCGGRGCVFVDVCECVCKCVSVCVCVCVCVCECVYLQCFSTSESCFSRYI